MNCFAPLFKELLIKFDADDKRPIQALHFAAIYGLVRIHAEQIKMKLVSYQSSAGYVRSFIESDASQAYYQALLDFLNKHENDFRNYLHSEEAKKYIVYTEAPEDHPHEPNHHLGFSFGTEMANENDTAISEAPAASFSQFEKRIFALAYFDMYEREVDAALLKDKAVALASNATAFIFAPVTLPLTLAGAAYYSGYLGAKTRMMKTALEGSVLRRYEIATWRHQIKAILSRPREAQAALSVIQARTFSVLLNLF